eukprot:GHVP01038440.1.p1 GENE.GHVP01038440.1~~GHVP01038440.1.p1  ORF type:complete len:386 (-),score=56.01 GHVP01038440.1:1846-3003(-)
MSESAIADKLALMKDRKNHIGKKKHKICNRDFSKPCPEKWTEKAGKCESPQAYKGQCGSPFKFGDTPKDKKRGEVLCEVSWPCKNECEKDVLAVCPLSWDFQSGGDCRAPDDYKGPCDSVLNFIGMSEIDRNAASRMCEFQWPCYEECKGKGKNYHYPCPSGWNLKSDGERCQFPDTYKGPCLGDNAVANLSIDMKKLYEEKCEISWPCNDHPCTVDLSKCPVGWSEVKSPPDTSGHVSEITCHSPAHYNGPCIEEVLMKPVSFQKFSEEEKVAWASRCVVEWPCVSDCVIDKSYKCPVNWSEENDACVAPKTYKGPCKQTQRFSSEIDDLPGFEAICKIKWRCLMNAGTIRLEGEVHQKQSLTKIQNGAINHRSPSISKVTLMD